MPVELSIVRPYITVVKKRVFSHLVCMQVSNLQNCGRNCTLITPLCPGLQLRLDSQLSVAKLILGQTVHKVTEYGSNWYLDLRHWLKPIFST